MKWALQMSTVYSTPKHTHRHTHMCMCAHAHMCTPTCRCMYVYTCTPTNALKVSISFPQGTGPCLVWFPYSFLRVPALAWCSAGKWNLEWRTPRGVVGTSKKGTKTSWETRPEVYQKTVGALRDYREAQNAKGSKCTKPVKTLKEKCQRDTKEGPKRKLEPWGRCAKRCLKSLKGNTREDG